jgi:hypothetical protein
VRTAVLVGLVATAALVLPVGPAAAPERTERLSVPRDLKVVSYYPADAGWTLMWEPWRPERLAADFRRLRGLNANTVRLVVAPQQFVYPVPEQRFRDRLAQAIALADTAGLHVQLTLFDWWYDYADRAGAKAWARALLAPYVGDARVAFVELRNELDPAEPGALAWARELVPWLRGFLRGTPVTLSVASGDAEADLRALARGLGAAGRPDFYTAHHFTGGGELAEPLFRRLRSAAAPAPLWLGEVGYPTSTSASGYWALPLTRSAQEAAQAHFLKTTFAAARQAGLPAPGIWILDDFAPGAIPDSDVSPREAEYTFGLHRVDGSAKPAAAVVRGLFAGKAEVGFNGGFEAAMSDAGGTQQPAMWTAIGLEGLDVVRATDVARTGTASASLRSTSARPGYGQLRVTPVETGVRAGRCAEAAAWARGDVARGHARLLIGWYDERFNRIARHASRLTAERARWTRARVHACPPPGAVFARVVVEAVGLEGDVRVDDVTFRWG